MGCLQSVACKARVRREQIVVSDVSATIEPAATAIEESSPVVLRYRTPYFRASARVLMPPIARRHTWVVGWIQACNHMEFYNTYSDLGVSSWELPDLREGRVKAISDSDGVSYPWYGNTTETVTLVGPTNKISRFSALRSLPCPSLFIGPASRCLSVRLALCLMLPISGDGDKSKDVRVSLRRKEKIRYSAAVWGKSEGRGDESWFCRVP
ncbi:protein FAM78B isoform X3 [Cygnus olor]|uniref:protein FAM78B isoform X2 n=1 Tax=Cygnus atratus TaxID=8868 RepID=UPI0015D6579C|nr:protein FAM78B isoform X2 [Cygnus atratus]XP_040421942.1 protein FAM78B isoform X3 [Cygnus olor]